MPRAARRRRRSSRRIKGYHGVTVASGSLTGLPPVHADWDSADCNNILHTSMPHYYRFGEEGESEEEFADRMAADLEELIQREGPETIAAFHRRAGDGCRWGDRAAEGLFPENSSGARSV